MAFLRIITADTLHDGLAAFRRAAASISLSTSVVYYCLPETWLGTAADLEAWVETSVVREFRDGLSVVVYSNCDRVLDTVRACVCEKRIGPANVHIVDVVGDRWHTMHVDAQGNLVNVPSHYRQWHGRATCRLLGFDAPKEKEQP